MLKVFNGALEAFSSKIVEKLVFSQKNNTILKIKMLYYYCKIHLFYKKRIIKR